VPERDNLANQPRSSNLVFKLSCIGYSVQAVECMIAFRLRKSDTNLVCILIVLEAGFFFFCFFFFDCRDLA
jgi:hypothetical protein